MNGNSRLSGYTLVEMMMVSVITMVIVATLGSMFAFVATRAQSTLADNLVITQATQLSRILDHHISNAVACTVGSNANGSTLTCTLPSQGTDTDGDGHLDLFSIVAVSNVGTAKFGKGQRITYYWSDSTGKPNKHVPDKKDQWLWRGFRNDDAAVTDTDIDPKFGHYYGSSSSRWCYIESLDFAQGSNESIQYSIKSTRFSGTEEKVPANTANERTRSIQISRTVNYRRLSR